MWFKLWERIIRDFYRWIYRFKILRKEQSSDQTDSNSDLVYFFFLYRYVLIRFVLYIICSFIFGCKKILDISNGYGKWLFGWWDFSPSKPNYSAAKLNEYGKVSLIDVCSYFLISLNNFDVALALFSMNNATFTHLCTEWIPKYTIWLCSDLVKSTNIKCTSILIMYTSIYGYILCMYGYVYELHLIVLIFFHGQFTKFRVFHLDLFT